MKHVGELWKIPSLYPETRSTSGSRKDHSQKLGHTLPLFSSSRPHGVSCLSLPACLLHPPLPEPILLGQLFTWATLIMTSLQSEPSGWQDLSILSSLTQSVPRFQISSRENQNGTAHPPGWFPSGIPNLCSQLRAQAARSILARQRGPRLWKRRKLQVPKWD